MTIPGPKNNRALRALLGHWSIDSILAVPTALPVNVYIDPGGPRFPGLPPLQMQPIRCRRCRFMSKTRRCPAEERLTPRPFLFLPRHAREIRAKYNPRIWFHPIGFRFPPTVPHHRGRINLQRRVDCLNILNPAFAAPELLSLNQRPARCLDDGYWNGNTLDMWPDANRAHP
jgi:hypothetical protein